MVVGDVDGGPQHEGTEGYAGDPRDEGEDEEDHKDQEHDASGVVLPVEHVDGSSQAPDDVQDASRPDKLLWEGSGEENVAVAEDDGDTEAEDEQQESVGIDADVAAVAIVDSGAVGASSGG